MNTYLPRHLFQIGLLALFLCPAGLDAAEATGNHNLIASGEFKVSGTEGRLPADFSMTGNVGFGKLGRGAEFNDQGFRLRSGAEANAAGSFSTTVKNLMPEDGRWFRLRIRALAQDNFQVAQDGLYMKVDFFRDAGKNNLDHITKPLFGLVTQDRKNLTDPGTNKLFGKAVWRSFDLEFRTPFPEVDTLTLSVAFENGKGSGTESEFWINEIELTPIAVPNDYSPPKGGKVTLGKEAVSQMVPIGGRWYYDPRGGDRTSPTLFNHENADRLLYLSDRLEAPFKDNMSAWVRKGYLDSSGNEVKEDRFEPDSVTITFTKTHLVMHSKCLPNHPTAVFPDPDWSLTGNPNYIQEKNFAFSLPLEPKENPQHVSMTDATHTNNALPMGPIGVAVNGVVFFNPFDAGGMEAIRLLDRCCGHPSPDYSYHYHKYPVCVKSPWADDGEAHSPLIGFAFDGFPIYGPYESKGVLAKDDHDHPLNGFNIHYDEERGWHYHVTPGQFPHVIGGYWGVAEIRRGPRGGRGRGGPPPGGQPQ